MTIRVRFAPSPTGSLHLGGARTALFNWLYARKLGGQFLLRIEDTDRERSTAENVQVILDGLTWLGLDWDADPVYQSQGLERHQALADRLLADGHAYEDDGAIRCRVPDGPIGWNDAVHGMTVFQGSEIADFVILRSDRTPTYNFAVVADDLHMDVTHVMRGDDHLSNTPKQIVIYQALGAPVPTFAHVPMIHGTDGKKLSKRHGATAVGAYRSMGILPAAMRNFLALLGWSSGDDRELFFEMEELLEAFSVEGIQKKAAVFDPQKLEWMNGQYISSMSAADLLRIADRELRDAKIDVDGERDALLPVLDAVKPRARTTFDLAHRASLRMDLSTVEPDEKAAAMIAKDPEGFTHALTVATQALRDIPDAEWRADALEAHLRRIAEANDLKPGKLFQPIRIALAGSTVSEGINELLAVVRREPALAKLDEARSWAQQEG